MIQLRRPRHGWDDISNMLNGLD